MMSKVADLDNGVAVYQATDEPEVKDNIYCERSYCSPDSEVFIYQRKVGAGAPVRKHESELVACHFGTWEKQVLGRGHSYPEISREGSLFYCRPAKNGERELVKIALDSGDHQLIPVEGHVRPYTGMTISPGEKSLSYGIPVGFDPQMFGVEVIDLLTGKKCVVCEDPYICNPHTQFDQVDGNLILVQQNRGCEFDKEGNNIRNIGEEGCTLFVVDVRDGITTPLLVGPPHTNSCTGHQQWIGDTLEVLLSISGTWDDGSREGNLLAAYPGKRPRVVAEGHRFSHVHASNCGRYFCCDVASSKEIYVGSIQAGRCALVCPFGPDPEDVYRMYGQSSHAHPYLSPDLKWVVFNSCRTGCPEIHVASLPDGFLDALL